MLQKLIEDLDNVEEDPLSAGHLERLMHARGISMRHLGKICTQVSDLCFFQLFRLS